MKDCDY